MSARGNHEGGRRPSLRDVAHYILQKPDPRLLHEKEIFTDGIVRPEDITSRLVNVSTRHDSPFRMPISWATLPDTEPLWRELEDKNPNSLLIGNLQEVGPKLFDAAEDTLSATLSQLTGYNVNALTQLRGWPLTFGVVAQVLMYEAWVGRSPYYFVVHLAKQETGTTPARQIEYDYNGLFYLHKLFQRHLTPQAQQQYSIAKPLSFGRVVHQGKEYPFLTMAFAPFGEIIPRLVPVIGKNATAHHPFFDYAYNTNESVSQSRGEIVNAAYAQVHKQLRRMDRSKFSGQDFDTSRHFHDLLVAQILIWRLTGKWMKHHLLAAGDFMGVIRPDSLKLHLITLRGGLTDIDTKSAFVDRLKTHTEPIKTQEHKPRVDFHWYQHLTPAQIEEAFTTADTLIKGN